MEDKHIKFQHQFHKVGLQKQIFEENTFSFPKADSSQLMEDVLVKTSKQTDRNRQADRQRAGGSGADRRLQARYLAEGGVMKLMQVALRCSTW